MEMVAVTVMENQISGIKSSAEKNPQNQSKPQRAVDEVDENLSSPQQRTRKKDHRMTYARVPHCVLSMTSLFGVALGNAS